MKNIFIGVMTGTSVDAIDIAALSIDHQSYELLNAKSYRFPKSLKKIILEYSRNQERIDENKICSLGDELAHVYAKSIEAFIDESYLKKETINAVGLHGQTISHNPNDQHPSSIQIGNGEIVASATGLTVVNDFRSADIIAGGQGAPLAPLFHNYFFGVSDKIRAVINIGGIANISIFGKEIIGYDIGPGNILMDSWCREKQARDFDERGEWAEKGNLNQKLLDKLLEEDFIHRKPPKSSGTDYFNIKWINKKLKQVDEAINDIDIQRTLAEFTATIITNEINRFSQIDEVAICGGGTKNNFLISLIREKNSSQIIKTDCWGMNHEWVEAAGFAYLAYLRMNKVYQDLSSITGSTKKVLLGKIN
jgi:anhydro-N-acetylmuramic acid kinase